MRRGRRSGQKHDGFDVGFGASIEGVLSELKVMQNMFQYGNDFELATREASGVLAASRASRRVSLRLADPW